MTTPASEQPGREAVLRDGSRVMLRAIRPEDKERLQRGFELLSRRSRYLRFHADLEQLTPQQLAYLTEVDHEDHEAWIALDPADPGSPGMGVARYVRLSEEPHIAEAAVTVLDQHQGKGLGTLLLRTLAEQARMHGVEVFRSYVLAENAVMLETLEALGGEPTGVEADVVEVDLALGDVEGLSESPVGRVFRAVASRVGPALSLLLPPLWRDARRAPERATGDHTATEHDRVRDVEVGEPGSPDLDDWADQVLGPGTG